ncbi:hypothetical protein BX600DRAFT_107023 [Xylariales sp. PMI_506]|nr:hypothetical protein BX600DRAFT_107023 [Xylariales sp. PMI_506]
MSTALVKSVGPSLLGGCCYEAERAERIAHRLEGLRDSLHPKYQAHLDELIREIYSTCRNLRDLTDQSQVHIARVPNVLDYLNIVLPCMCRTLSNMLTFYEDRSRTKEYRWREMWHALSNELPGTTLPARFVMYNQYLRLVLLLLIKSPNFDLNGLESLKERIFQLREVRNIPAPSNLQRSPLMWHEAVGPWEDGTKSHWAESIFTRPLPTRTEIEKQARAPSKAFGTLHRLGHINISPGAKTLIKRSFDNDRLSVTFFLQSPDEAPYLLIRTVQGGNPWVSMLGAHELCIQRHDAGTLYLLRWSKSEACSKTWASLAFITWEEMVLFYCTFVSLKRRSILLVDIDPKEFHLKRETRQFAAQIMDDGFYHCLTVYHDAYTGRRRLHASVWDGPMKNCPVWTAFLPPTPRQPSLVVSKSRHRIRIRDIQPYVFCQRYRLRHQVKGRSNAFELNFVKDLALTRFLEIFDSPDTLTATGSSSSDQAGPSGT